MIRVNLLKPGRKEIQEIPSAVSPEYEEKKKKPIAGLIFLLLIIVVGALFVSQRRSLTKEQNFLNEAQEEKNKLQDVLIILDQLEEQKNLFQKKITLIEELKARQDIAVVIMEEISVNIPDWVWLTEMSYNIETVRIKGKSLSNILIADFIYNLEESPYFGNVNLISSTQKREKNDQYLEFSLTAEYVLLSIPSSAVEDDATGEKK